MKLILKNYLFCQPIKFHTLSKQVMLSQSNYVSAYVSVQFWILHFIKSLIQDVFLVSNIWLLTSIFPLSFLFSPNLQNELPCLFPQTVVKFCVQKYKISSRYVSDK